MTSKFRVKNGISVGTVDIINNLGEWIGPGGAGGGISATGTPVDNQLAVWTSATDIEGTSALTFDGTTARAYINGIAAGTDDVLGTMFDSTEPIEIGARNNAHFFNGNIDEVRIWTRVLTEAEILAQKDGVLPSTVNGLAAYYKFNQGTADGDNTSITTFSSREEAFKL